MGAGCRGWVRAKGPAGGGEAEVGALPRRRKRANSYTPLAHRPKQTFRDDQTL